MPKKEEKSDLKSILESDELAQLRKAQAIGSKEEPAKTTDQSAEEKPTASLLSRLFKGGEAEKKPKRAKFIEQALKARGEAQKLPTPTELEEEWKLKIKEAKKKEVPVIAPEEQHKGPEVGTVEEVFDKLKKSVATGKAAPAAVPKKERLAKIQRAVREEVPEIRERELTGVRIPLKYRIYPVGQLPPLNLLSRVYLKARGSSLESALEAIHLPLYVEEYAAFSVAFGFFMSILAFVVVAFLMQFNLFFATLILVATLIFASFIALAIPSSRIKSVSRDINKQLPFALRHISALLSAGISIFDSIASVARGGYGSLSYELDEVVWDVKSGESLSNALEESSTRRVKSKAYNRVVVHIRRALQMGGNISEIIGKVADDMTFEMRMKISDFVEKLNAFAIVYLIGGIVGPVVVAIFSIISSVPVFGGGGGSPANIAFMMLFLFPAMMALIVYVVKVMEPKV